MDVVLGLSKTLEKHTIGLVLGVNFPNLPRYRVNLTAHAKFKRQVDLKLSSDEVAENTSFNRTIDESPHNKIAYDLGPRQPTDLISIPDHCKVSKSASSPAASHMHELYKEVNDKISQNNANYELRADVRNILTFNVNEIVKRLHSCSANSFQILNKLNEIIFME